MIVIQKGLKQSYDMLKYMSVMNVLSSIIIFITNTLIIAVYTRGVLGWDFRLKKYKQKSPTLRWGSF